MVEAGSLSGPITELNIARNQVQSLYTELSSKDEAIKLWEARARKAEREVIELREKLSNYEF